MLVADRIVRMKTVLTRTGLSRSTIYRKIAEGSFPAQIKISTNGAGWKESDINRWVANPAGWRQHSFNEFDFLDDFWPQRRRQTGDGIPFPARQTTTHGVGAA